jgi:TonB family protein
MRNTIIASLLLSPMLFSAAANASSPKDDATASTPIHRVSTGVTPPHIIHSAAIQLSSTSMELIPNDAEVQLNLKVDENGKAQDIQVVKSVNPMFDARVVEAVRQFRWSPATLDQQAIPLDLNLIVTVQR